MPLGMGPLNADHTRRLLYLTLRSSQQIWTRPLFVLMLPLTIRQDPCLFCRLIWPVEDAMVCATPGTDFQRIEVTIFTHKSREDFKWFNQNEEIHQLSHDSECRVPTPGQTVLEHIPFLSFRTLAAISCWVRTPFYARECSVVNIWSALVRFSVFHA